MTRTAATVISVIAFSVTLFLTAGAVERYVWTNSPSPDGQYLTWNTAARTIQDAINASSPGDLIIVTNGLYNQGGLKGNAAVTNRVFINKAVTVRSVNGPDYTIIEGKPGTEGQYRGRWRGWDAFRCVELVAGAVLDGFTLTNGNTCWGWLGWGGGAMGAGAASVLSNCVVTWCMAQEGGGVAQCSVYNSVVKHNDALRGGGVKYCNVYNSTIVSNVADNMAGVQWSTVYNSLIHANSAVYFEAGGAVGSTLYNCTLVANTANYTGGGSDGGTLYNCILLYNTSRREGAGVNAATVYNSLVLGNVCSTNGGGASRGTLYNCVVVGNTTPMGGGGVYCSTGYNCIVCNNRAAVSNNCYGETLFYSCSQPLPAGPCNIDLDPKFADAGFGYGLGFVAGDYHLRPGSPCINAGTNFPWMSAAGDVRSKDLGGSARIYLGTVDMGAYEHIPPGTIFIIRGK